MRYFHGGCGGMYKGMMILPPKITKAKSTASMGNYQCDTSRVYVTTDFAAAAMYAAAVNGDVYEVAPIGDLVSDPDCTLEGLSFSCERARILRRHRLTAAEKAAIVGVLTA